MAAAVGDLNALAGKPTSTLSDVLTAIDKALPPIATVRADEPPPVIAPQIFFPPVLTAVAMATKTKSGKELPIELFDARVTSPSGAVSAASTRRGPDGRLIIAHHPTEPGDHSLVLSFRGVAIGPTRSLQVRPGVPRPRGWAQIDPIDRVTLVAWICRRLRSAGLEAVYAVISTVLALDLASGKQLEASESLRLLGVAAADDTLERWPRLQAAIRRAVPDAACAVLMAQEEWRRGDGHVRHTPLRPAAARAKLQASYSRAVGPLRKMPGPMPPPTGEHVAPQLAALAAALGSVLSAPPSAKQPTGQPTGALAADAGDAVPDGDASADERSEWTAPHQLRLVAITEQWAHAGSVHGVECGTDEGIDGGIDGAVDGAADGGAHLFDHVLALQLEGFAPQGLRPALERAAASALVSSAEAAGGGDSSPWAQTPVQLDGVVWYDGDAQGRLLQRRVHAARTAGRPPPSDSIAWLREVERFCSLCVPGGLLRLMCSSERKSSNLLACSEVITSSFHFARC